MRTPTPWCITLLVILGADSALAATVVVENSGLVLPLQGGQITSFTYEGHLTAQCVQNPSGTCEGLPQDAGAEAVLQASATHVAVGSTFDITWTPEQGAEICLASSSAGIQGWSGIVSPAGGVKTVTATAEGTATLAMKCFNVYGSAGPAGVSVIVGTASGPGPGGCNVVKSEIVDPFQRSLFQPEGFQEGLPGAPGQPLRWNQLFGPGAIYPNPPSGNPYPVGSYTLAGNQHANPVSTRGRYITMVIVGDGNNYKFEWIQAKPVFAYNYQPSRPTDFHYITLSTCRGDFRTTSALIAADPQNDPSLIQQCRNQVLAETGIIYGPTGFGRCPVKTGQTWYLNIVFADIQGGLSPWETGCRDTVGGVCETSWLHNIN